MSVAMYWEALSGVLVALGLSLAIGVEREFYSKSAGMRTHVLVGMGSALFTVVSKFGFLDAAVLDPSAVDGSRVAAQIVSGIGFLGAGLIFVRRDAVRGLTTAAGVWFVAAVGMAAGAGLTWIALTVTLLYLGVMVGMKPLSRRLPHARATWARMTIHYADGRGVLRDIMGLVGDRGLKVVDLQVLNSAVSETGQKWQVVDLEVEGPADAIADIGPDLREISGVREVTRR